jgi:hypothetical protein
MADGDQAENSRRRTMRLVLLSLSLLWAGFWLIGGIGSGLDPAYEQTLASGLALGLGVGVLPCLPLWLAELRRFRRRRRAERARDEREAAHRADAESARQRRDQMEKLPLDIRNDWERIERSRLLVQEFADEGWIEQSALLEMDRHISQLRTLLEADARTERLGGESSATLRTQVRDLTALLVALADAAVEHQATLITDDPVPATLAEARDRLARTTEAYRDLQQPG